MANPVLVTASTDWGATGSWDTGSVPVDTDSVYLRNSTANIITNLNQSSIQPALLEIERSFTGDIGAASSSLQIGPVLLNVGRQVGPGSQTGSDRIKIDSGTDACVISCYYTATTSADTGYEPFRWKGTGTTTWNHYGGIAGIATNDPDDTATVALVNILGGTLNLGAGVTLTTVNMDGASSVLTIRSALTTLNQNNGAATVYGSGAQTTLSLKGGTHTSYGTGTVTTANVFPGATLNKWSGAATITTLNLYGTLDLSLASGTITVTNFNRLSEDAVIYDPLGRLTATNGIINGAGIRRINNYTSAGGKTYTIS